MALLVDQQENGIKTVPSVLSKHMGKGFRPILSMPGGRGPPSVTSNVSRRRLWFSIPGGERTPLGPTDVLYERHLVQEIESFPQGGAHVTV